MVSPKWIWDRIGDGFTFDQILDLLGWKIWLAGILLGAVSSGAAMLMQAPAWAIFLCGLGAILVTLVFAIFIQQWTAKNRLQPATPISSPETATSFHVEGFIPMRAASEQLYAELPSRFIKARAKASLEGVDDGSPGEYGAKLLKLAANYISGKIPVHGTNSSSGVFGKINMANLIFNDDITRLTHVFYEKSPGGTYTDIAVRQEEFVSFLAEEHFANGYESITNSMNQPGTS